MATMLMMIIRMMLMRMMMTKTLMMMMMVMSTMMTMIIMILRILKNNSFNTPIKEILNTMDYMKRHLNGCVTHEIFDANEKVIWVTFSALLFVKVVLLIYCLID